MYNPIALVRTADSIEMDFSVIGHRQFQTKNDIVTEKWGWPLAG
jgi:hypothetical protein